MALPESLLALLPPPAPVAPGLPTGLAPLDAALGGGLPRGRLTEVVGAAARGSGRTTLLRRIVEETIAAAGWVAYIDAARTLAPRDWAHLGAHDGLWVIRPRDPARAAWCADVLLRSGAFALVVLDSGPPLPKAVAVRLTRLAREASAAFVVTRDDTEGARHGPASSLGTAVRLSVRRVSVPRAPRGEGRAAPLPWKRRGAEPGGGHDDPGTRATSASRAPRPAPRAFAVVVEKGGLHRTVEVCCAIAVARRVCAHPQIPDRRGVAQRETGRPGRTRRAAAAADASRAHALG